MKVPTFVKYILWNLFIKEKYTNKLEIINFIKHDEEFDVDMFLVFIAGQKGYIMLDCVDHHETSVEVLKDVLENKIKILYNLGGMQYNITTIMHGEEPENFAELKKKALETPNMLDKFKSFIMNM